MTFSRISNGILMPWLLVFAGAAQPVPENEAAELVARIEQAAGPRNATLLGSDRLIEFEGRFVTTARLEPTEKPDDPYRIAQMEDPKISTFSVRIARFGDHELIDFRSREIDPFHAAYPFSQQAARLRKGRDRGIYLDRQRNSVVEGRQPEPARLLEPHVPSERPGGSGARAESRHLGRWGTRRARVWKGP